MATLKTCVNCRERIVRYPCPFCKHDPKPEETEGGKKKFPWLFVAAGMVLFASTGIFNSFKSTSDEEPNEPPVEPSDILVAPVAEVDLRIDAEEMWSDYAVNPRLADEKYKGKTVAVIGRVVYVDVERNVLHITNSEGDVTGHDVVVFVRGADGDKVKNVTLDDLVIVVCSPAGLIEGVPVLGYCTLVR